MLSQAMSGLGRTATLLGRTDAQTMIERAIEYADSIQFMAFRAADLTWLAYTHLWEGRPDQAIATIERALDRAKTHEQGAMEAEATLVLGAIKASRDVLDAEDARQCFSRALSLAEAFGMRPLAAHCHLGLGKLYRRVQDAARADEHLVIARDMSREMNMGLWFDEAPGIHGW